jgi:hypothetical protein
MGQEILYCSKCQIQLRTLDFEKEKAYRINGIVSCFKCAREVIHSLPPETIKRLIAEIATKEEAAEKKNSSTSRILRVAELKPPRPHTARTLAASPPRGLTGGLVAAVVVGAGVLLAALLLMTSGSEPSRRSSPPPAAVPSHDLAGERDAPSTAPSAPARASTGGTFEAEASESLLRARTFARMNPQDWAGQLDLYEKAVWEAGGTAVVEVARRELEDVKRKDRELAEKELSGVLGPAREAARREDFGRALASLKESRTRHRCSEWTAPLDLAIVEIRGQAAALYGTIREAALSAARTTPPGDLKPFREHVARWELEDLRSDLERALGSVVRPPPKEPKDAVPPVSPEAASYVKVWSAAADLASGHDYPAALREIERALASLKDANLKKDAQEDLEAFRLAATVLKDALQALSSWPKDRPLAVAYRDDAGAAVTLQATAVRVTGSRLEARTGKNLLVIELGDLEPATLADLYRNRPNRTPQTDARALSLFLLLEGDLLSAKSSLTDPSVRVPERFVSWAQDSAEQRKDPSREAREAEARRTFVTAEQEYALFPTRADAVLRFRTLGQEYASTRFVRRNAASIAQRSEPPKDFVFLPGDLVPAGSFRLSETKAGTWWTSESDVSPPLRKTNYVELDFSILPEGTYRLWAHAGGCCAETLSFFAQGTEMKGTDKDAHGSFSAEPGDDGMAPVRHSIAAGPRTHASHGGRKQPSKWGWAEIPLPKYSTGGRKIVRLLSDQQGFSVEYAVVSSSRSSPPTEAEMKELQRLRGSPPAGLAEAGLVGYWKFDEGKGTQAADSSPSRNSATLTGGASWSEGKLGGAVQFSGPGMVARVPAAPTLADLGPVTLMAWVRPTALALGRVVCKEDAGRGRWLFIAGEKTIAFAKDFSQQELRRETGPNLLPINAWSHVAVTWDGSAQASQVHLYVNGMEPSYSVTQDGKGDKLSDAAIPLLFGNRGDLGRGFVGAIDELRIYRRILSPAEIAAQAAARPK